MQGDFKLTCLTTSGHSSSNLFYHTSSNVVMLQHIVNNLSLQGILNKTTKKRKNMVKILKKGEHSKGSSFLVLSCWKFNTKCTTVPNHWKLLNPNNEHVFLPWDKFLNNSLSCILRIKGPNVILHKVSHMLWLAEILKKKHKCIISQHCDKIKKANPKHTFITHLPAKLTMAFFSPNGYYNGGKCMLIYFEPSWHGQLPSEIH